MLLTILSFALFVAVFMSRIRHDFWVFRVLEYPRLQVLGVAVLVLALWAVYPPAATLHWVAVGVLAVSIGYLLVKVWPYTRFAPKEMKAAQPGTGAPTLTLFAANVLQTNHAYPRMLAQIKTADADLIFLLETDAGWAEAMQELTTTHPHTLACPLSNTYGLLFYSRLPLEGARINYLVKPDIPSIEAIVCLPAGDRIKIWGLHPEPPVPGENRYATAKDKELMKVALQARDCPLPVMVFGDLNDVAWSHTTELFRKTSGLLDPRRGRGFYSTFSAHHWWLRFPLDYVFCSPQFGLCLLRRLPPNGSDHFATLTQLCLQPRLEAEHAAPEADGEEIEEAKEKAAQGVPE